MLRENETAVLRAVLREKTREFNTFKEAVDFIRLLRQNDRVVGKPILGDAHA